jgi:hypothetical protein
MPPSGLLRSVALVTTEVSKKRRTSITRLTRIGEKRAALAVTSNLHTLLVTANVCISSPILSP